MRQDAFTLFFYLRDFEILKRNNEHNSHIVLCNTFMIIVKKYLKS